MESLNLNVLANSLPPSNLANAEKELMNNFKAAALSLTTLYRSSRRTSKRAYNAGYAAACQDLLCMIQQGVSAGESSDSDGQGMTIGRIMDYIEARMDAIRSREEEEDEDEEKEKDRAKPAPPATAPQPAKATATAPTPVKTSAPSASSATSRTRDPVILAPPTPYTPNTSPHPSTTPASPSPSFTALRTPAQPLPLQRASKGRLIALANAKEPSSTPFPFSAPVSVPFSVSAGELELDLGPAPVSLSPAAATDPLPLGGTVGAKRRHNVMMLESGAASAPAADVPGPGAGGSMRRRTRSARGTAPHVQDLNAIADAMDVEEEGRERKRVARR